MLRRKPLVQPPILRRAIAEAEAEMHAAMEESFNAWMREVDALRSELAEARRELDTLRALGPEPVRPPDATVH
jgi:hypothetical protein